MVWYGIPEWPFGTLAFCFPGSVGAGHRTLANVVTVRWKGKCAGAGASAIHSTSVRYVIWLKLGNDN